VVFYEKGEQSFAVKSTGYAVALISPIESSKLAYHMEPEWTEGNHHDLVTMAQLFGFEYDKVTDEAVFPEGRPVSSFRLAVTAGSALLSIVRDMMGTQ
jgi:hypothetical protein